jgi:hypothetical protein
VALFQLTLQLVSIENKVNNNTLDLGTVHEKVNLAMTSITLIQEEQVQVAQRLQLTSTPTGAPIGDVIFFSWDA